MVHEFFDDLKKEISRQRIIEYTGRIERVIGMAVESMGPMVNVGDLCKIYSNNMQNFVYSEVVGFKEDKVLLMPLGNMTGIGQGNKVVAVGKGFGVPVSEALKGRIVNALGEPMDGKGKIHPEAMYDIDADPPNPLERRRIKEVLQTGVKSIDNLLTLGTGQRVGIFAGSGVGKSSLLGMMARSSNADINVIVLAGERGREVLDFVEKDLQEDGLKKSVLVVATSDQSAMLRLKSCMVGTAIAEFFRDKGYNVMLMMDSLTRFAMAQREIGMAIGEPPVARGYTPSVYSKLPRLLERAGTSKKGSITGIYTVLVDGDDINDPISDTVRGILDGHIILSRKLANANHYPPIDILASVSRLMPDIVDKEHLQQAGIVRNILSTYKEAADLISIGAYKNGSSKDIDYAISRIDKVNNMLMQDLEEQSEFSQSREILSQII